MLWLGGQNRQDSGALGKSCKERQQNVIVQMRICKLSEMRLSVLKEIEASTRIELVYTDLQLDYICIFTY